MNSMQYSAGFVLTVALFMPLPTVASAEIVSLESKVRERAACVLPVKVGVGTASMQSALPLCCCRRTRDRSDGCPSHGCAVGGCQPCSEHPYSVTE